jgi:hypothetical protein
MAIVSFLLSNHELFIKPMQPIHFARGYEWTAYFFMGLPALHLVFKKLKGRKIMLNFLFAVMLLDNCLCIVNYIRVPQNHTITHVTTEQKELLNALNKNSDVHSLVIGRDKTIPYLSTVYTKAYSWISHPFTTSNYDDKWNAYQDFLDTGKIDTKWLGRKLIFVFNKSDRAEINRLKKIPFKYSTLFDGKSYIILETQINPTNKY